MELYHFSHREHALILKEVQEDDVRGKEVVCYGYCEPVLSGSTTYCCSQCKVFLHKCCAELPIKFKHPKHPEHPLQLFRESPFLESLNYYCNICRKDKWNGFIYQCSKCCFGVDILCARLEDTFEYITSHTRTIIEHASHPHPLKLQERQAMFMCDACGVEEKDESYDCTVCSFRIHKTCGSLPNTCSFKCHPAHPLFLSYYPPEKYQRYTRGCCDICGEMLHPYYWVYYCGPCRYVVHLSCVNTSAAETNSNNEKEIPPNIMRLPADNLSQLLIKRLFEQTNYQLPQVEVVSTEIKHFSHHHPLILSNIQDDYYEFTEDDQETVCNACIEPVSGSCYSCAECSNYFIHLLCAQLPKTLSSSHHPQHTLSLHYHEQILNYSECSVCKCDSNGFMYRCIGCDYFVDIKCALLPDKVKHESHPHILVRDEFVSTWASCNACDYSHKNNIFFRCKTCPNYKVAMICATSPKSLGHRWDKHPLTLSFPPFDYHPHEFTCDMCEDELHPKFQLYHCRECDNSFHGLCIPRIGTLRNIKFGGKLEIDEEYHPHPLTFTRKLQYKSPCDKCGVDLKERLGVFACETCYATICLPCVRKIVKPSRREMSRSR